MASITLENVSKEFGLGTKGTRTAAVKDLSLEIHDGDFMIIVGPSGCGKTTALRLIAGLEKVTRGAIRIGHDDVPDVDPGDRDAAMVFQSYALYPHMSVEENIAFPLKMSGVGRAEREARIREVAEMLSIEELLGRRPRQLSGGQRQRVAMARAIIRRPRVFLMDEPLSNLDAKLRVQMRAELIKLHARLGITTVYVTHDQTEAMTLGSRVAVLRDGELQQIAPPLDLYRDPANAFVAGFMGSPPINFVRAARAGGDLRVGRELTIALDDERRARLGGCSDLLLGLRPEGLVHLPGAEEPGEGAFAGVVEVVERLGSETIAYVRTDAFEVEQAHDPDADGLPASLAVRLPAGSGVEHGQPIVLGVDREQMLTFDAPSGRAL